MDDTIATPSPTTSPTTALRSASGSLLPLAAATGSESSRKCWSAATLAISRDALASALSVSFVDERATHVAVSGTHTHGCWPS